MKQKIIAITGPSGSGKTTLGDHLIENYGFITPVHTTTRDKRKDDKESFYRYIQHDCFKEFALLNQFLFWSGDALIIDKKLGNYYGILKSDYDSIAKQNNIIFFISYKDLEAMASLIKQGLNIDIVNLMYKDLEKAMKSRLSSGNRNHTEEDIRKRILCAKNYEEVYESTLIREGILRIPTDVYSREETCDIVVRKLIKGER